MAVVSDSGTCTCSGTVVGEGSVGVIDSGFSGASLFSSASTLSRDIVFTVGVKNGWRAGQQDVLRRINGQVVAQFLGLGIDDFLDFLEAPLAKSSGLVCEGFLRIVVEIDDLLLEAFVFDELFLCFLEITRSCFIGVGRILRTGVQLGVIFLEQVQVIDHAAPGFVEVGSALLELVVGKFGFPVAVEDPKEINGGNLDGFLRGGSTDEAAQG